MRALGISGNIQLKGVLGTHSVPGAGPGFYSPIHERRPGETFLAILDCLTDSGAVVRSGAIEDDFLVFRQPWKP
jgi:hypothetical protein